MIKTYLIPALTALIAVSLTSCATTNSGNSRHMSLRLGQINDVSQVKVRVSLANRAVYVYEGAECKWAAAVAIGKDDSPTPRGNFKVFSKLPRKRSNTYGFWVNSKGVQPGKRVEMPSGYYYKGYPMPNWVEFHPGYGFHSGAVWPQPRTKGCLRLHKSISGEFFNVVKNGTQVYIADSLPEDSTIGRRIPRPTDYAHPDSPPSVLVTDAAFDDPRVYY